MAHLDFLRHKIVDREELRRRHNGWSVLPQRVAFTNGCFDLLHAGPAKDRQRFLDRLSSDRGKAVHGVSSQVQEILTAHDYPGNIRELENIVEHAWVMSDGGVIEPRHLPPELTGRTPGKTLRTVAPARGLDGLEAEFIRQVLRRHKGHRGRAAEELGVHRTTLQRKIKKLGIEAPDGDGRHRS